MQSFSRNYKYANIYLGKIDTIIDKNNHIVVLISILLSNVTGNLYLVIVGFSGESSEYPASTK